MNIIIIVKYVFMERMIYPISCPLSTKEICESDSLFIYLN